MTDERLRELERTWRRNGELGPLLIDAKRAGKKLEEVCELTEGEALRYLGNLAARTGLFSTDTRQFATYVGAMDRGCRLYVLRAQAHLSAGGHPCTESWICLLNHAHNPQFSTKTLEQEDAETRLAYTTKEIPHGASWRAQARAGQALLNAGKFTAAEYHILGLPEPLQRATGYMLLLQTLRGDQLERTIL